ncbi:MAG: hypothetical protein WA964_01945 [Ilumatobacter sp.]|uniref:helix-turn-helix domain-containing protein n=1 Tax=Ilumatobacter sp. TaxID=1967498 RepID=UPI003C73120D
MPDNATAAAADHRIQRGGSAMLFAEPVLAQGRVANIDDALVFYAGGRGGVLGNVPWQQVQSAFGFFPAEIVRNAWHQVTSWGEPLEMAGHFAKGLADFGRSVFPADAAQIFADLGNVVADSVTPLGYALFSGWRAMPRPDDGSGAAAIVMMTLRELRGDIHVQDIAAAGIRPIEAEVVVRGLDGIALHGWSPPYPDPNVYREAVAQATAQTTARMQHIYETALLDHQWTEFVAATRELSAAIDAMSA